MSGYIPLSPTANNLATLNLDDFDAGYRRQSIRGSDAEIPLSIRASSAPTDSDLGVRFIDHQAIYSCAQIGKGARELRDSLRKALSCCGSSARCAILKALSVQALE